MTVSIYLNDGEDHFFGFKNDFANSPELTKVWQGPIEVTNVKECLELVFEQTNIRTKDLGKHYAAKGLRSISVGDVVVVGETAWSCESSGWLPITSTELTDAIIADDTVEAV